MPTRDVRAQVRAALEQILTKRHIPYARALAQELLEAIEGHGVRLARPAHLHDPAANDWHPDARRAPAAPPETLPPDHPYFAARAALAGEPTGPEPGPGATEPVDRQPADTDTDTDTQELW